MTTGAGWQAATQSDMWTNLHRAGTASLVFLVGVQAVIAGQHIFGSWGIALHANIGNAAFSIAVLVAAIAILKLDSSSLKVIGVLMLFLLTSQIGLGYSARGSEGAAAIHIPLGVATFGALIYQLLASWPRLVPGLASRHENPDQN